MLDSLSVVPGSVFIDGPQPGDFVVNAPTATLRWLRKPAGDSILVRYRVFPFSLYATTQHMRYDSIAGRFYAPPFRFDHQNARAEESFFDNKNIVYNGSFGRALAFGNRQDAVVNSTFQLQIGGMLKDSIELTAALTDNNIPIQPDGTTQQLNEFDQVFIEFKKQNWRLNLGDIDLRHSNAYFLNFYKRLQGISFETTQGRKDAFQSESKISGSIAKGKFTRNVFQGQEGNQGPYRLTGASNELFFIVLANTERVFVDGELLQRGEDRDYVINYNTAEVVFMPARMITKDSRIQVEFEYADRNYLNANLFFSQKFTAGDKLNFFLGAYNNSDARNSQINQVLDNRQKQFLFNLGDRVEAAYFPAAALDSFATGKLLYELVYDTTGGQVDSFYRYSTDPQRAKYALNFTDVGMGNGNYVADFNGANGKVYRHVRPVNGMKQGRFEPVMFLVTPKKHQVLNAGATWTPGERFGLQTEIALSNFDRNTFSPLQQMPQGGVAGMVELQHRQPLHATGLALKSFLRMEHVAASFRPVERLRSVEFSREWGLPLLPQQADENILKFKTALTKTEDLLGYQFTSYRRGDGYQGMQHLLTQGGAIAGWQAGNQLSYTRFSAPGSAGYFLKPVVDLSRVMPRLRDMRVGFRYSLEHNEVRRPGDDSLLPQSFSFDTYTAYIKSDETKANRWGLNFFTRADRLPFANELADVDRSYNINLQTALTSNPRHQFLLNTTYRMLQVYNKSIAPQESDRSVLGRAEYLVNEWGGLVTGNVLYELGAGQEQRRDFIYLEVPAGQGEFTWIDNNGDGVQQLNEFEQALFRDQAKYIRIFTPTNDFTRAAYNSFNYNFNFNPRAVLGKERSSALSKFLSRVYLQTSLQKNRKNLAGEGLSMNPFKYNLQDTSLITNQTSLLNNLSFNRFHPAWGFDLSNVRNSNKALLTYGYETRVLNDWLAKARVNIGAQWNLELHGKQGVTALYTPGFANRNYHITTWHAEPRLSFVEGTRFRLQGSYKREHKLNSEQYGGEATAANILALETRYNVLESSSLQGRFSVNDLRYTQVPAQVNPSVEYLMLDALRPGSNYLWSIDFTRRLMKFVEVNFQYEGRKPAGMQTIHTGRASLRALF